MSEMQMSEQLPSDGPVNAVRHKSAAIERV